MNEADLPITSFQTFYVSKEETNCPLISEIVRTGKKFKEKELVHDLISISMSLKYGRRMLINAKNTNLGEIKRHDLLEIADYDPIKKVILTMGRKEPRSESSIHWLIHHARNDVNAIIQINDAALIEKLIGKIPETEKEYPNGTLEQAKEVLKILRESRKVIIKNQGLLFVGNNAEDVEKNTIETLEEIK